MLRWTCVLALAITTSACAATSPTAHVRAHPPAAALLAGQWNGTYAVESGKAPDGTITFALDSGTNGATGRVKLQPAGEADAYRPRNAAQSSDATRDQSAPLMLRVLTASDGLAYGDVDPYWDAARRTDATMTLRGELKGDAIAGTFRTTYADGSEQTLGRWTAKRGTTTTNEP